MAWREGFIEYLSFDDVAIVPGRSPVEPSMVKLESAFSRRVKLGIPVASSPMDTVTGWRLASALARVGAIGVIHRNMSVEEQVKHVRRVKEADPSLESEVVFAKPRDSLSNIVEEMESRGVNAALIVKGSDVSGFILLRGSRQEYWASKARGLASLMGVHDPQPLLDDEGRLVVAAAISPFDVERAKRLEKAGADVLVLDVAHAYNENVVVAVSRLAREVSVDIVVGNVGTRDAVLEYASRVENVAGFRVGIGSGSICSTSEVTGAYVPTLTAVFEARSALEELGLQGRVPIIADGGIRGPGDAAKALIAGASAVMSGRLFAGCEEAESPRVVVGGRVYKQYRGMASRGAIEKRFASDRYSKPSKHIVEGVEGLVPYTGSVYEALAELVAGLKAALGYAGAKTIKDSWKAKLAKITPSAAREAKPHDLVL